MRNDFYPNYSLENWDSIIGDTFNIGIPMVCFCDISLSQIHNHAKVYGNYALGLTKSWGKKNGICPVLYTFDDAATSSHIKDLFRLHDMLDMKNLEMYSSDPVQSSVQRQKHKALDASIVNLALYMKPYEGRLIRNTEEKRVRYYDEREWRYVPNIDESKDNIKLYLKIDEFNNNRLKKIEVSKLKNKKLSFEPKDIKYIIVKSEKQLNLMVNKVKQITSRFPPADIEKLITRIITMEQIRDDF